MSNPQTVDVENPYSKESRRVNALIKEARKKQDEDKLVELSRLQKRNDFLASAYFDSKANKFFIPDTQILACIKEAAKSVKKAKDIDRCVLIEETEAYIEDVPCVKSLEDAYENEGLHNCFKLLAPAKIPPRTGSLFMKMRCMMPTGWTLRFKLTFDDSVIAEKTILTILNYAGKMCGIGSWRPKFGRFLVEVQ